MYFLKKIVTLLMPPVCILCKNLSHRAEDLCLACFNDMPLLKNHCQTCANALPENNPIRFCGYCLKQKPPFDTTHGLFFYEPPVTRLILDLKFHHKLTHARLFGELLAKKIMREWYQKSDLPTAIIPVPLHVKRLSERGFNQALEIARPIAKALNIPLCVHDVIRIRPTLAQATLPANARKRNIKNAFVTQKSFENRHIAVIDDVITTGNTLYELCSLLRKHGAARISVWCVARRRING